MRRVLLLLIGILFAMNSVALGFSIDLGRDPFMDLMKLQELKRKEFTVSTKKRVNKLQEEIRMLLSSLKVTMVVSSENNPSLKAALIVGPSGIPMVVVKGQKIRNGVYVEDINEEGVKLIVESGNERKTVILKIAK